MGNSQIKELEEQELGQAYLDRSSPKVISGDHITHDATRFRQRGDKWFVVSKEKGAKESRSFSMKRPRAAGFGLFKPKGAVLIRNDKDQVIAILKTQTKLKSEKTLIYRLTQTFSGQPPTPEIYQVDKKDVDVYLFACIKTLGVSKCDAAYCLLQVNEVYNDPDFAKFQEPMYKASKVNGITKFAATISAGDDPTNLLGKLGQIHGRSIEAEAGNGVDFLAVICLGLAVNHIGTSAGGLAAAGVV